MVILGYFFLFLHKNICCGYSLEAPRQGQYIYIYIYGEMEKDIPELSPNTPS